MFIIISHSSSFESVNVQLEHDRISFHLYLRTTKGVKTSHTNRSRIASVLRHIHIDQITFNGTSYYLYISYFICLRKHIGTFLEPFMMTAKWPI